MSIIDKEDLKYLPNTNTNDTSNSIIDVEDQKYLNNTSSNTIQKNITPIKLNLNTGLNLGIPSTKISTNLPKVNIINQPETIRTATPEEIKQITEPTFQDILNNYSQNTKNKETVLQKIQDYASEGEFPNLVRNVVGSFTGAPESLIRTLAYGTALATGAISQSQYNKIIKDEKNGTTKTISGIIADNPEVGSAIKLGEDEAYRKIAGAGGETFLNYLLPSVLKGESSVFKNILENTAVGAGYGVAQEAQSQNPNYLRGAGYGAGTGLLLSGTLEGIKQLPKLKNKISNSISQETKLLTPEQKLTQEINNKALPELSNKSEQIPKLVKPVKNELNVSYNESIPTTNKSVKDIVYHASPTENLSVDAGGNINFGINKNDVTQFGENISEIPLKDLRVKKFSTKEEMFNAINNNKQNLLKGGIDAVSAENQGLIINPEKVSKIIGKNLEKPFTEKSISDLIKEEKTFQSKVFDRIKQENPNLLEGDLTVNKINLNNESEKAIKLLETDKQKLYDIAMGKEASPDITSTIANITLAQKAIDEGNNELASKLIKNRSLAQTRRGQEIVAEKASLTDNSSSRYIKQLISERLDEIGKKYTDNLKDLTQKTLKQKAVSKIEKDVNDLEKRIKNKKIKTSEALALLDKLTCLT